MKAKFNFGKVAYRGNRRENTVEVEVELRVRGGEEIFTIDPVTKEKTIVGKTPEYIELSICGNVWNRIHTDILCGGQCLDEIADMIKSGKFERRTDTLAEKRRLGKKYRLFFELYNYWKKYHLNGMYAGTPEQEAAIEKWKAAGNKYDYKNACEYLKSIGLYEVRYTGLSIGREYIDKPYRYGTAWLIREIPADVVHRIKYLIENHEELGV